MEHTPTSTAPGWADHVKDVVSSTSSDKDSEDGFELPPHICFVCGALQTKDQKALMKCGNCHAGRYCSRECQKQAWKGHKPVCKTMKEIGELREELEEFVKQEPKTTRDFTVEQSSLGAAPSKEFKGLFHTPTAAVKARNAYFEEATGAPSMFHVITLAEYKRAHKRE